MNVSLERGTDLVGTLRVTIPRPALESAYKKQIRQQAAKAQMKGFRPGKVPASLIERMYGQAIKTEALEKILEEQINGYLKDQEGIIPNLLPAPDQPPVTLEGDGDLEFAYRVGMMPEEAPLPEMSSVTVERNVVTFDDQDVDQFLDQERRQKAPLQDQEVSAQDSALSGKLFPQGDETASIQTHIAPRFAREGAQEQFIGRRVGDTIEFVIEEAFDKAEIDRIAYIDKDAPTPSGPYTFVVERVQGYALPALTESFFIEQLGMEAGHNVDEYRQMYRERLATEERYYSDLALADLAFARLMERYTPALPEQFIKDLIEDKATREGKPVEEGVLENELMAMRRELLLRELERTAGTEVLKVEMDDVLDEAEVDFRQKGYGQFLQSMPADQRREVLRRIVTEGKDRSNLDRYLLRARIRKASRYILSQATVTEKHVTYREARQGEGQPANA